MALTWWQFPQTYILDMSHLPGASELIEDVHLTYIVAVTRFRHDMETLLASGSGKMWIYVN